MRGSANFALEVQRCTNHRELQMRAYVLMVILVAALYGCGGSSRVGGGIIPFAAPTLSWTAQWIQGMQSGPIHFNAIGESAVLTGTAPTAIQEGPPYTLLAGSCVSLSSSTMDSSTTVTATSTGSCTITVTNQSHAQVQIQAQVP